MASGPATCESASPEADRAVLDVPFLPQTEALCGGAATAMIFRFWGDRHASVQQFAPLVDRAAGGIAVVDLIEAIRERRWIAETLTGSIDAVRHELRAGRPPMLLIEDRPQRYHYVVAVGADENGVLVHDPTWGPAHRMPRDRLLRVWQPTGFWMLRVTPGADPIPARSVDGPLHDEPTRPAPAASSCDARLDDALAQIAAQGVGSADVVLPPLIASCPGSAGPVRELAGVRFTQRRWREAEVLATRALAIDPGDAYTADLLGASRFLLDDLDGALRAWNRAGRPLLDSVRVSGLSRTRYALLTSALGLHPEAVLTAGAFQLARRRLEAMPDLASTRLAIRPDDGRWVVADVAVVEKAALPRGVVPWLAAGARAAIERDATVSLPGRSGQGERWSATVGWWTNRPRLSMDFTAPLVSGPRGVWRVGMLWAAQSYGVATSGNAVREERLGGTVSLASWLTPHLEVTGTVGADTWSTSHRPRTKTVHAGVAVDHRRLNDRLTTTLSLVQWIGRGRSGSAEMAWVGSRDARPLVLVARAGGHLASADAPLAAWSGAGEGRSRGPLLRAHTLMHDGRIDGPVFGQRLAYATVELQHWLARPRLVRLGFAVFVDAAAAGRRPAFVAGLPWHVDAGTGIRVRVPGTTGAFRVDYAHGLRDRAAAWFIGWQPR